MSRGRLGEQLNTLENSCGRIWKVCQKKQCSTKMQQSKRYVTETDLEAGGEQEEFLGWPFGHLVDGLRHWLMWAEMRLVLYFPCTDAHRDKYPLFRLTSSVWKVKLEQCWKRQLEWFWMRRGLQTPNTNYIMRYWWFWNCSCLVKPTGVLSADSINHGLEIWGKIACVLSIPSLASCCYLLNGP